MNRGIAFWTNVPEDWNDIGTYEGDSMDGTEDSPGVIAGEGVLKRLWRQGLCRTVAKDDPRWLTDAHSVRKEAERLAIAAELWKTVCSDCPVWALCLRWAVENGEVGVWAGTTQAQRKRIHDHWQETGRFVMDLSEEAS